MNAAAEFAGLDCAALPARPVHLAIGMFDGVHLGHRAVLDAAVASARRSGGVAAVLTFFPHPSALFDPEHRVKLILPAAAKRRVLERLGIGAVITEPFTRSFSALEAEAFLPYVRARLPGLAGVYVGENWRFGHRRRGDAALLVAEGKRFGLPVFTAPRVSLDGEPISSTRIRGLVTAGAIAEANRLLGYAYFAEGVVARGKQLGRTIGFPTLNVSWNPDCRPALGVYAVRVAQAGAEEPGVAAVANYGLRPTVEQASEPRLEVHVLGECSWSEGDALTVTWLEFLRPERKFSDLEALREQIARDRAMAADFFR